VIRARAVGRRPPLLTAGAIIGLLWAATAAGCGDEAAVPRILQVSVPGDGRVPDVATGVVVGDGRVLTVAHVLGRGRSATVLGRPAAVVRIDRSADLALLSVPGSRAAPLRFSDGSGAIAVRVLRDGRPRMLRGTVRRRVVARVRGAPTDRPLVRPAIELGVGVAPGDSGAPVLDRDGRLLGLVFAQADDRDDTAWAVDAAAVRELLGR
jgi:S1-C subfamily serine protease